jgi:hypothetical protein
MCSAHAQHRYQQAPQHLPLKEHRQNHLRMPWFWNRYEAGNKGQACHVDIFVRLSVLRGSRLDGERSHQ